MPYVLADDILMLDLLYVSLFITTAHMLYVNLHVKKYTLFYDDEHAHIASSTQP